MEIPRLILENRDKLNQLIMETLINEFTLIKMKDLQKVLFVKKASYFLIVRG